MPPAHTREQVDDHLARGSFHHGREASTSCSARPSEPYQQPVRLASSIRPTGSRTGGRNRSRSRVLCHHGLHGPHLVISELGDLSLQRGREGAPQRLLRHRAGPTHRLGGLTYAVDHVRPPSPPGWAGTRGYLRDRKTCVRGGVKDVLLWCEYAVAMAPPAYQGRFVMPTGPLSRVDAWGGA